MAAFSAARIEEPSMSSVKQTPRPSLSFIRQSLRASAGNRLPAQLFSGFRSVVLEPQSTTSALVSMLLMTLLAAVVVVVSLAALVGVTGALYGDEFANIGRAAGLLQ
jgi:hypothetical protein